MQPTTSVINHVAQSHLINYNYYYFSLPNYPIAYSPELTLTLPAISEQLEILTFISRG